jgi:hypothetical protein
MTARRLTNFLSTTLKDGEEDDSESSAEGDDGELVPVEEELIEAEYVHELGQEQEEEEEEQDLGDPELLEVEEEESVYAPSFDGRPCSNTTFGCCSDKTDALPAHGPGLSGCCLSSEHGCCPDHRRAAEGPDQDGCQCEVCITYTYFSIHMYDAYYEFDHITYVYLCLTQNSAHGCCPDDRSPARGPGFAGCGCRYSQFGCCPDQYTAASGPETGQGCPCHTYQYGCCPDGVTVASGPNQVT